VAASYSFDDTRILRAPNAFNAVQRPGHHLLRRPVNSANIVLNANFRRWNINLREYLSGIRTDSDFLGVGITRNPGYARLDMAGSYEWGRGVTLYGRATNLLDKRYQDAVGYPALGRDARVGLNYRWGGRN
jgi:outer membrane cobalamin receptor